MIGIAKAGLVAVPVNPLMAPDVLRYVIGHVEARFAIVDAELWPRARGGVRRRAAPGRDDPDRRRRRAGTIAFADWIAPHPATEPDVRIHGDDIWSLLFTSGTTSMPKAVMSSHTYSYAASQTYTLSLTRGLRFESDFRCCTFLPIVYHCGHHAALFSAFFAGGTAIVGRRPDAAATVAAITAERATAVWAGSPLLLQAIAARRRGRPAGRPAQPHGRALLLVDDASRPRRAPEGAGGRGPRPARGVRPDRGDVVLPLLVGRVAGEGRGLARDGQLRRRRRTRCWRRRSWTTRAAILRDRHARRGGLPLAGRHLRLLPRRGRHARGVPARLVPLRRQLRATRRTASR